VLQVRLCLVYFIGGQAKFLGNRSGDGSALWRSLIRPPFDLVPPNLGSIFAMHAAIGTDDGEPLPLGARHDCDESGGIWRSQYDRRTQTTSATTAR
jgi:hypothetical protein